MQDLPKGRSEEVSGNGAPINQPGIYFHEKSGQWIEGRTTQHADAFVRVGYVPATKEHLRFIEAERQKISKKG